MNGGNFAAVTEILNREEERSHTAAKFKKIRLILYSMANI